MFKLTLVTPQKKLFTDAEVEEVIVPAERGELNILTGHSPLISTLETGVLRFKLKGEQEYIRVSICWGYLEVIPGGVRILAETAEIADQLDFARAENAKQLAEEKLKSGLTVGDVLKYQRKLKRAEARLSLRN